ncbi:MAG TPA: outer membrane protein transport protein [Sideroxyarcus sp.]|nr:outer membrane protein transport protein [Sideroxyarcus sp.]
MIALTRLVVFLAAPLLVYGNPAVADEYHYNSFIIGERASGMGGAYTAISDDASGMFYNPAAIVYVGDRNFSASVNAYYSQTKKYDNVIGTRPYERKSTALLANYFGIVKPFGDFKVGFSYAVPDSVEEDQNQTFDNVSNSVSRFTINLNNQDKTYNFGPSLAMEVNDKLAIGLTLYAHQRKSQIILNQFVERVNATNQWVNRYYRLNESGVRPILGVAWAPVDKVSLGMALSKTYVLSSDGITQDTCWDAAAGGCNATATSPSIKVPTLTNFTTKRKYPLRIAVGAAYFVDSDLLFSADVTHYTAVRDPVFGEKMKTTNLALGTEYYLSKKSAVRFGLYTNMANTPNIQAGVTTIEEQINIYGITASISTFSGSSSVTLGTNISSGKGKSQILNDSSVQNASTFGWLVFLSSSY